MQSLGHGDALGGALREDQTGLGESDEHRSAPSWRDGERAVLALLCLLCFALLCCACVAILAQNCACVAPKFATLKAPYVVGCTLCGGLSSIFIPPNDHHPACQENTGSTRRRHQCALGRPGTPLTRSSFWRREGSWPPSRTSPRQPTALTARRGRGQHRHPLSARSTRSQKRRTRSRTKRLSDARIATTRC